MSGSGVSWEAERVRGLVTGEGENEAARAAGMAAADRDVGGVVLAERAGRAGFGFKRAAACASLSAIDIPVTRKQARSLASLCCCAAMWSRSSWSSGSRSLLSPRLHGWSNSSVPACTAFLERDLWLSSA